MPVEVRRIECRICESYLPLADREIFSGYFEAENRSRRLISGLASQTTDVDPLCSASVCAFIVMSITDLENLISPFSMATL